MHKNIEEILLDNINLPQNRGTWRKACQSLNQLLGLYDLSNEEKEDMQIYWHMVFIRVAGERHIKKIKFQERCAIAAASKIVSSREGCNDN